MGLYKVKTKASKPYKDDDVTPNPLWPHLMHARAFSAIRLKGRDKSIIIRNIDDEFHKINDIFAMITQAETDFGNNAFDARWPAWIRILPARFSEEVPAYLPVDDIAEGDPPVSRRPRYEELHLFRIAENGNGYAPASDGRQYIWASILLQLDGEQGINLINPSQVPVGEQEP